MTRLTLLAVFGLIYVGALRLAYFFMSVFIILFFGMTTWQLIRRFNHPTRNHFPV